MERPWRVAPQHADVDGPQTAEARGDGFDTDRAVVHRLIQRGHPGPFSQPKWSIGP